MEQASTFVGIRPGVFVARQRVCRFEPGNLALLPDVVLREYLRRVLQTGQGDVNGLCRLRLAECDLGATGTTELPLTVRA